MTRSISLNSRNEYEVSIDGQLDDSCLGWFGEAQVHAEVLADEHPMTVISGVHMDQAGLVGLIRRLHGHGIVLLSVRYTSNS